MNVYRYAWLDLLNSISNDCPLSHYDKRPCRAVRLHRNQWDFTKEYACGFEVGRTWDGMWVTVV